MAYWQIMGLLGACTYFDDSQTAGPGDPSFSTTAVKAQAGTSPFNYLGPSPNFVPQVEVAEAAEGQQLDAAADAAEAQTQS